MQPGVVLGNQRLARRGGWVVVLEASGRRGGARLAGALANCRQTLDHARQLGLTTVISSGVESSLALTQLSRLAHWLTPAVTLGLDTLSLMQAQLVRPWPGCDLPLWSLVGVGICRDDAMSQGLEGGGNA